MIPRMTTVGTLKNYRYDLNRSNNTLAKAMQTVTTRRNFNSYAEDPALAVRCFQIRRSYQRTESQLTVNDSLRHKYDVAWEALDSVSTDLYSRADDASVASLIRAASDSTGPGRLALGQSLCAKARDIAQIMNGRYGENYVFAGADTLNPPFTWEAQKNPAYIDEAVAKEKLADKANLTQDEIKKYGSIYQYVANDGTFTNTPLDPADPTIGKNPDYNEDATFKYLDINGDPTNDKDAAWTVLNYRGVEVDSMQEEDKKQMEYFLNNESKYIDVGLGHKEEDGEAISSTVFDSSLQGVHYLGGYGTKTVTLEDGTKVENVPTNVISLVNELGQILQRCNPDDGDFQPGDRERFDALVQEFESSNSLFRERWTEMDTQAGFLRDNSELLQSTSDSLLQQYTELEEADPVAAISEYMFARYCYDAALKVGNSVLSQSLMDYMNF